MRSKDRTAAWSARGLAAVVFIAGTLAACQSPNAPDPSAAAAPVAHHAKTVDRYQTGSRIPTSDDGTTVDTYGQNGKDNSQGSGVDTNAMAQSMKSGH